MGAYNPLSYHNGSVWPHDTPIVAAGLMRYGFVEEAKRIGGDVGRPTRFGGRLPSCSADSNASGTPSPVSYPASCSPQAWAAATPFSLLRTPAPLRPVGSHGDVWLAPTSSEYLGDIHLRDLPFAGTRISVDAARQGASVVGLPAGLTMHRCHALYRLRYPSKEPDVRIGIIAPPIDPIPPTAYGGVESFIDTLARALHDTRHDVVLAASGDSTSQVPRLPGFEPSDPAMMGVTAHELRHLLRAFDGLDDSTSSWTTRLQARCSPAPPRTSPW